MGRLVGFQGVDDPGDPVPVRLELHLFSDVLAQNRRGEWVPAIPVPFWVGRWRPKARCLHDDGTACGRTFETLEAYEGHFALVHVLGLGLRNVSRPPKRTR